MHFVYRFVKATGPKLQPLNEAERAIVDALLVAVARIRSEWVTAAVLRALGRNDIEGAIETIRFDLGEEFLNSVLPQHLRKTYELAGAMTAAAAADTLGIDYRFNVITPEAVDWVRQNAGSLIQQWGDSSRQAVRNLIAQAFQEGTPIAKLTAQIRSTGIGLTWRQARAVLNMRHRLEADGVAADTIDARAERYFKRLLRYRAEMIARTETARASIHARLEAWRQGIARGLIDPARTQKEWLTTHDARACDLCLDLDGARAEMPGGIFVGQNGTNGDTGPPKHPSCRCDLIPVETGSQTKPRAQVNLPGDLGIRKDPPWRIERHGDEFWVVGIEDGRVFGKHKTRPDAIAQMRALYANVPDVQKVEA